MTARAMRRARQVNQENPQNVTVIEDGVRKVISWEEYQERLSEEENN